jgi:hypothetical protein
MIGDEKVDTNIWFSREKEQVMYHTPKSIASVMAVILCAGVTQAVVIAPAGNIALSGTSPVIRPELGGVVQEDALIPFGYNYVTGGFAFSGNVQGRVILSTDLSTMIFEPRMRDFTTDTSGWGLVSLTMKGYTGWSCDVDFSTTGSGTIGPGSVSRSVDGDKLTFSFAGDPVISGEESRFTFSLTDAPAYVAIANGIELTFINDQKLSETIVLDYFAPIPEPATIGLMCIGAVLFRRRIA